MPSPPCDGRWPLLGCPNFGTRVPSLCLTALRFSESGLVPSTSALGFPSVIVTLTDISQVSALVKLAETRNPGPPREHLVGKAEGGQGRRVWYGVPQTLTGSQGCPDGEISKKRAQCVPGGWPWAQRAVRRQTLLHRSELCGPGSLADPSAPVTLGRTALSCTGWKGAEWGWRPCMGVAGGL